MAANCVHMHHSRKEQKWAVPYPTQIILSAYYLIQVSIITLFYDDPKAAIPFYCTILAQSFLSQRQYIKKKTFLKGVSIILGCMCLSFQRDIYWYYRIMYAPR